MKTFAAFRLNEASPRNVPVEKTEPTDKEKELVRRDIGRRDAVRKVSGEKNFIRGAEKIADVEAEVDLDKAAQAVDKAKEFAATTVKSDTGRVVANPEVKKLKKANPKASPEELSRIAAKQAEDKAEARRKEILAMPRGPERDKLLGDIMLGRMRQAARAGQPGALTKDTAANIAVDKAMRRGEGGKAFKRFKSGDTDVFAQSGIRHLFAGEIEDGYDKVDPRLLPDPKKNTKYTNPEDGRKYHYNDKTGQWKPEFSADDVSTGISLIADPESRDNYKLDRDASGEVVSKTQIQNKELGQNPQMPEASAAEIDFFKNDPVGQQLLKALDEGDIETVQKIAFTHNVGEVGSQSDAIDEFIARADVRTDLSRRGLDGKKYEAMYGGIFEGEMAELAKKYQVEGAPEGVYNTVQMEKDGGKKGSKWKDPKLKELYDQMFKNREYESVRTYLQQGMRDGYVPFQGYTSIELMNLEHGQALKSEDPNARGFDHPSNWIWASEPLNKVKNKYKLGDRLQQFDEPRVQTPASGGPQFRDFKRRAAEASGQKEAAIQKVIKERIPALTANKKDYGEYTQKEIDKFRKDYAKLAKEFKVDLTKDEIRDQLPDPDVRPGFETDGFDAFDDDRRLRTAERMELDTSLAQEKRAQGLPDLASAAASPSGAAAVKLLKARQKQRRKGAQEITAPVAAEPATFNDI